MKHLKLYHHFVQNLSEGVFFKNSSGRFVVLYALESLDDDASSISYLDEPSKIDLYLETRDLVDDYGNAINYRENKELYSVLFKPAYFDTLSDAYLFLYGLTMGNDFDIEVQYGDVVLEYNLVDKETNMVVNFSTASYDKVGDYFVYILKQMKEASVFKPHPKNLFQDPEVVEEYLKTGNYSGVTDSPYYELDVPKRLNLKTINQYGHFSHGFSTSLDNIRDVEYLLYDSQTRKIIEMEPDYL